MDARALSADITLATETAEILSLTGDQSLLTQMLINLVENAIKYGRTGGYVKISAKAFPTEIILNVSDNGIGIPSEEQLFVFERFYRADKASDFPLLNGLWWNIMDIFCCGKAFDTRILY